MGKTRRFQLSHLDLEEISLVDRPANPGAKVLLIKRDPAARSGLQKGKSDMSIIEIIKKHLASVGAADDQIEKAAKALSEEIGEVVVKADHDAAVEAAVAEAIAKVKPEDVEGFEEAVTKAADEKIKDKGDPNADIKKGLSPDALARFEKLEAEREEDRKRIAKVEEERHVERITKRVEPFSNIVKADDIVPIIAKMDDDDAAEVEKVLAKVSKQAAEADAILTKSKGHGMPAEGSAMSELNAKAEELRKADSSLSEHQAFRKACNENPALLARHREEQTAH